MSAIQAIKKFRLHVLTSRRGPALQPHPETPEGVTILLNPFLPWKNPQSGRWRPPKYSLRRQAELIKKAKASNTLHLLPPGPKLPKPSVLAAALESKPDFSGPPRPVAPQVEKHFIKHLYPDWTEQIHWEGELKEKVVAGADIGNRLYASKKRMFKGHKWERVKEARERKMKILMRDMAKRVTNYKAYYHRRKPNPLKPARSAKAPKLPF